MKSEQSRLVLLCDIFFILNIAKLKKLNFRQPSGPNYFRTVGKTEPKV